MVTVELRTGGSMAIHNLVLCAAVFTFGAGQALAASPSSDIKKLKAEVAALQARLSGDETKIAHLEARPIQITVGASSGSTRDPSGRWGIPHSGGDETGSCPAGAVAVGINHGGGNNDWWLDCARVSAK